MEKLWSLILQKLPEFSVAIIYLLPQKWLRTFGKPQLRPPVSRNPVHPRIAPEVCSRWPRGGGLFAELDSGPAFVLEAKAWWFCGRMESPYRVVFAVWLRLREAPCKADV